MRTFLQYDGTGPVSLTCVTQTGHAGSKAVWHLCHSSVAHKIGQQGVAIVLRNRPINHWWSEKSYPRGWSECGSKDPAMLVAYVSTLGAFYMDVQRAINPIPRSFLLNSPPDNTARPVFCRFLVGDNRANGDRLVNMACLYRLVMASITYDYPKRHLLTRCSNHGQAKYRIVNIPAVARWAGSILSCRVYRSVSRGSAHGSDYCMCPPSTTSGSHSSR